jgi:hypothetical protein
MREFDDIDKLIAALRSESAPKATLTAKVATATSPGGGQIAFRGSIVVEVQLGESETATYVDHVMPYITNTKAPQAGEGAAADLRSMQLALARQLRSYRGEYQAVVDAARAKLAATLEEAGVRIVEPDD